jgi:hypothetical protein
MTKHIFLIPTILLLALSIADTAYAQTDTPTPTPTITPTPTPTLITPLNLDDGLIACWPLDEESETRYDVIGNYDLSDNNTVGSVAGVKSNAAYLQSANSERLSGSSTIFSTVYSISGWFYVSSYATNNYIIHKPCDYLLRITSNQLSLIQYVGCSTVILAGATVSNNAWHFFIFWHTSGGYTYLQMDNGTVVQTATSDDTNSNNIFLIGDTTFPFTGYVDEVAFWTDTLSADERAWLYNYGAGRSCSDIANLPTPTPVPSATPTPGYWASIPLSSGDYATIERSISYGDIFVIGGIALILAFAVVYALFWINRSSTGKF